MVRTPSRDKNGLKRGTWTPEEDRKLVAYVTRYGCWNWRQLPRFAGLARCGKSCRLRWLNYLRPNIRRGNFTQQEDDIIVRLHTKLGNRWSAIAAELPGRTDNEIKNHWHTNLKKHFPYKSDTNAKSKFSMSKHHLAIVSKEGLNNGAIQTSPPTSQNCNSLPLSPQSPSSEFSCISTDTATTSAENLFLDDDLAFLGEYTKPIGANFWAEPCMEEISILPSEPMANNNIPLNQNPTTSQILDAWLLSSSHASPNQGLSTADEFAFLDVYTMTERTMENFWTEPFMVDMSSDVPSKTVAVTETEYLSAVLYGEELPNHNNLYDIGIFY